MHSNQSNTNETNHVGKETRISKKITSDLTDPRGKDPLVELLN